VKRSWKGISTKIIIDSFKTCGISNPLNDIGNSNEESVLEITDISDDNLKNKDINNDNLEDDKY